VKGGGKGERRKEKTKRTGIRAFLREIMTVGCAIYRLPNRSICKGKGKGGGKRERKKEKKKGKRTKGQEKGKGGRE
jgi:hypothetical protein